MAYAYQNETAGYYPPSNNRFQEGDIRNTGYNRNNQYTMDGYNQNNSYYPDNGYNNNNYNYNDGNRAYFDSDKDVYNKNYNPSNAYQNSSRIPPAPYSNSPAYSSATSGYPRPQANLPHSSDYYKGNEPQSFPPPGHIPYESLNSYSEDTTSKEMSPTTGYSAVAPETTGPQPPKNYDSQKPIMHEDETDQEAKHGGLMKYFCCGSRASCAKTCGIICCILILIIIGLVAAILLWGRPPQVNFLGVTNPPNNAQPYVMKNSGFDFNFGLLIQVNNPNVVGATFSMIKAVAYYPGHQSPIGGGNLTNVNIPSKSNNTITFPFAVNYDSSIDPGFSILLDIATKCGLTGGNKTKLTFDYTLTLTFNVLFIPLSPSFSKSASIDCPIQNGQIPNIPGFNLSQAASSISSTGKTSKVKRFIPLPLL